jgi:hypothetical protein
MNWVVVYICMVIINAGAYWVLADQFNPMTRKQKAIGTVKFALLWPLYWFKAMTDEFL